MFTIYNTPDEHPRIHDDELLKIKLNVSVVNTKAGKSLVPVPWLKIITSVPVLAISVAKFW